MYREKRIIAFLIAALLLITAAGCESDKPLWERLEDLQYSSYTPRLRFLIKKYGDIFEMDEYGQIPTKTWKAEYAKLTAERKTLNQQYLAAGTAGAAAPQKAGYGAITERAARLSHLPRRPVLDFY